MSTLGGNDSAPAAGSETSANKEPFEPLPIDHPATSGTETEPVPLSSQPSEGRHVPAPTPEPDAVAGAVAGSVGAGAAQSPWPQAQPISEHVSQENAGETSGSLPAPSLESQTAAPVAAQERPAAAFIATADGSDVPATAENRTELEAAAGGNSNFRTGFVGGAVAEASTQSALLDEQGAGQRSPEAQGLQPELHGAQGSTAPFGASTATLERPRTGRDGQDLPVAGLQTDPELIGEDIFVRSGVLVDGTHYACANCGLPRYVHSVLNARCPGVPDEPFPAPPDLPPAALAIAAEVSGSEVHFTVHAAAADVGLDYGDDSTVDELFLADADDAGDLFADHTYDAEGDYTARAFAGRTSASAVVTIAPAEAVAPSLSGLAPTSGDEMATTDVTLTGTEFTSPGAKPQWRLGTTGAWNDETFSGTPTATEAIVALDTSAAGTVQVRVTNDVGSSPTQNFTVNAPAAAPTLTALSPTSATEA